MRERAICVLSASGSVLTLVVYAAGLCAALLAPSVQACEYEPSAVMEVLIAAVAYATVAAVFLSPFGVLATVTKAGRRFRRRALLSLGLAVLTVPACAVVVLYTTCWQ